MAEEKKVVQDKAEKKVAMTRAQNILSWFTKLPSRITKPFKNMWYELKKVTWPTKRKLLVYSGVVLAFMVFMSIVIGVLDMGASALVKLLVS
jgi:preprotein translocase subunit SecE